MTSLVLTLIGPDRTGLVEAVSDVVARHKGNWLESRMAHLAGQFAGILHIEAPEAEAESLKKALGDLGLKGLRLHVDGADGPGANAEDTRIMRLDLVGQDQPGIVKHIAQLLASHRVNVEDLTTDRESAPMTGEPLFRARARLRAPAGVAAADLRAGLERIAADLQVDIKLLDD